MSDRIDLYLTKRDGLETVLAGFPWFLDWGRDTLIVLRALIEAGRREEALRILRAFAAFEDRGTLPNIIRGNVAENRDTTDAPLWFVRCVRELGDDAASLRPTCESIVANYLKGTPNGIRVDAESGLVWSPAHFTWMDTNYPACTPRAGYPVEIQALWISALEYLGRDEAAARARASVERFFRLPGGGYADCLSAPNGESAADAAVDASVRPNQLFLVTLGITADPSVLRATEELIVPGAMRSLSADDAAYRGVYTGDEDTSRKPAYHNGTAWGWLFPLYAEALVLSSRASCRVALSLLASAVEAFGASCVGHLAEIADGDAPHAPKGCAAQAWSDSEFFRVWTRLRKLEKKGAWR